MQSFNRRQRDTFVDSLIAQSSQVDDGGQGLNIQAGAGVDVQATSPSAPIGAFADQKERIFSAEFNRPNGLQRIAFAMHPTLKNRLDYHAIGRNNILVVDEINTGDVPFYDVDLPENTSVFLAGRGEPTRVQAGSKRFQLPTSSLSRIQQVSYEEIPIRRFPIFDRAKERVAISIAIGEDDAILGVGGVVDIASQVGPNTPVVGTTLNRLVIADAGGQILDRQLQVGAILMHTSKYKDVWKWSQNELDQVSLNKLIAPGYIGTYLGARLLISTRVPRDKVFIITTPDKLGRLSERKAVEVKIFDNVPNQAYDILGWELIGLGIYNPAGVSVIDFS